MTLYLPLLWPLLALAAARIVYVSRLPLTGMRLSTSDRQERILRGFRELLWGCGAFVAAVPLGMILADWIGP